MVNLARPIRRRKRANAKLVIELDLPNRKRLPWADDYFVPKPYAQNRVIIGGSLNVTQQATVLEGLKAQKLATGAARGAMVRVL